MSIATVINTLFAGRFLSLHETAPQRRPNGTQVPAWRFVSRRSDPAMLPAVTGVYTPDAVAIEAVWYDESQKPHLVLVEQFRAPVGTTIVELPAGLVDKGEFAMNAALRETFEETGLKLNVSADNKVYCGFSSAGCTDEYIGVVTGVCEGTPTSEHQEADEDILVILADAEMCQLLLDNQETKPCDIRATFAMRLFIEKYGKK